MAAASNTERSLSVTAFVNPSDEPGAEQFDAVAKLLALPGFDPIRAGELSAFGPVARPSDVLLAPTSRVVFRERLCEHVIILSGRCLAGALEVVLGEDTAAGRPGCRPATSRRSRRPGTCSAEAWCPTACRSSSPWSASTGRATPTRRTGPASTTSR